MNVGAPNKRTILRVVEAVTSAPIPAALNAEEEMRVCQGIAPGKFIIGERAAA